jgi:hypothetical protein
MRFIPLYPIDMFIRPAIVDPATAIGISIIKIECRVDLKNRYKTSTQGRN